MAVTLLLRRRLAGSLLAALCLTSFAGCRDDQSDLDAAGRAPATDLFAAWPGDESFRVASEPIVVVGAEDALPLSWVGGGAFFGDGIAIANGQFAEVLILDPEGRLIARQGRRGDGPGEYLSLENLVRHRDGLIAWDVGHRRANLLDASGSYVGATTLRPVGLKMSRMVGAFGNSLLREMFDMGFPGTGTVGPMEVRLPVAYEVVRLSDGEVVFADTLAGEEKWAARIDDTSGRRHGGEGVIFGRKAVAAVTDRYAYLATTDSLTITRYDEAGNAEVVSLEHFRERANEDWEQRVRETVWARQERSGSSREVMKEFSRGLIEDLPARATLPAFSEMKGGADGLLWIREYPNPFQEEVAWVGFTEAWERKKRITMPVGMTVLDIAEDRVLARGRGANDEELVEVYPLVR